MSTSNLSDLAELLTMLRANGVTRYANAGFEVQLDPSFAPPATRPAPVSSISTAELAGEDPEAGPEDFLLWSSSAAGGQELEYVPSLEEAAALEHEADDLPGGER